MHSKPPFFFAFFVGMRCNVIYELHIYKCIQNLLFNYLLSITVHPYRYFQRIIITQLLEPLNLISHNVCALFTDLMIQLLHSNDKA